MTSSNRRMLVVGNGFDLAHGLPTKYQDMLDALSHDTASWLSAEDRQRYSDNPLLSISANIKICPVGQALKASCKSLSTIFVKVIQQ